MNIDAALKKLEWGMKPRDVLNELVDSITKENKKALDNVVTKHSEDNKRLLTMFKNYFFGQFVPTKHKKDFISDGYVGALSSLHRGETMLQAVKQGRSEAGKAFYRNKKESFHEELDWELI